MRIFSWLVSIPIFLAAACFFVANRGPATLSLWPLDVELTLPLYVIVLSALFLGLLAGALIAWCVTLPHRFEARRLRKALAQEKDLRE